MNRQSLYDTVKTVCPTYWVGQHEGECKKPYAVIKYKAQSTSLNNANAGWQYLEVMVYVPHTSTATIESLQESIKIALAQAGAEPTGNKTPDYVDTEKKAIMRSEEFRIPKVII